MQFTWLRAAAAAFSFTAFSLTVLPAQASTALATSGPYTLTQSMVNDDLAVWQIVAGRALAPADRQAIQDIDLSQFHRDPAWVVGNMRQTHKMLPGLMKQDAAQRANLRQTNLVEIYCTPQVQHLNAEEASRVQAVLKRYVPVVGVDAASSTVITERDLDAAVAAARFMAAKTKTSPFNARYRSDLVGLSKDPAKLGSLAKKDLTDMERNWAAFQLTWPHESAAYQAQMLNRVVPVLRQDTAKGEGETGLCFASLSLPELQYADYPYALDPRLAAYKRAMDAKMSRFQNRMLEYNLLMQQRSMHDFARSMNGQGPDPQNTYNPVPLPTP